MKTNKIADFKVKDLPNLKKSLNAVTADDKALVKPIWISAIERCLDKHPMNRIFLHGLPNDDGTWGEPDFDEALTCFAACHAPQRRALQALLYKNDDQRGQSFEQLKWLNTTNDKAGFYPENISYSIPINLINPKKGLFEMKARKGDKITKYKMENSKKMAKKVTRKMGFTYEFWELKFEKIIPTIHNIPDDIKILISELTGKKENLQDLIAEAGGSPYKGALWLRRNPEGTFDEAVVASINELIDEMKEAGLDFKKIVSKLMKSLKNLPEETIREIVIANWEKWGDKFSLKKCTTQLKRVSGVNKPCTVWNDYTDFEEFPSTEMAARKLGYTPATIQNAITTGSRLGKGYYVTRNGKRPSGLAAKFMQVDALKDQAQVTHELIGDKVNFLQEEIYWDFFRYDNDLSIMSKIFKLKEERIALHIQEFLQAQTTEINFGKRYESETPHKVESVQTSPQDRPAQIKERFGVEASEDRFNPCPNRGILAHLDGVADNINGVKSPEEEVDDLVVT